MARFLIADDDFDVAWSLSISLRSLGHMVRITDNGRTALELVRDTAPDILVADLFMPEINGFDIARLIRDEPALQPIRLIAVTGKPDDATRQRALDAGFDAVVLKPVDPEILSGILKKRDPPT